MATKYPLPVFHFRVDWGGSNVSFSEVTGLVIDTDIIQYRSGASPSFTMMKMPGMQKFENIKLKRGILAADNEFFAWYNTLQMHTIERRDVTISLLNEKHEPVVVWKVRNAFPVKLETGNLSASNNEVAIETIELAHEGISIENQ